jgi:hypothetical protein
MTRLRIILLFYERMDVVVTILYITRYETGNDDAAVLGK